MTNGRYERMMGVLARRQPDLIVVMENVFDPHNISAVIRTCDSVGIGEVFMLHTRQPPHQHLGFRSSAGSWKWIQCRQYTQLDECLSALRKRACHIYAAHAASDAVPLYQMDLARPMAIVFGNEQDGCSPEMLQACDGMIAIPQVGMVRSLNISVACAVILYEAYRQKSVAGHYDHPRLEQETMNKMLKEWTDPLNVRAKKMRKP
ncbi:MAG TPA: RNA methyltransferase [Phnomibacter sp.]|nr:RNA methyltransferase [Phnomibacter sp.]